MATAATTEVERPRRDRGAVGVAGAPSAQAIDSYRHKRGTVDFLCDGFYLYCIYVDRTLRRKVIVKRNFNYVTRFN